ncbi:MAG: glycosyltransferase family 2 protein [Alphaproteobacteria bacterium]
MDGPLVTVAICTRNRAALLDECIASVREQTLPTGDGIAIVVVDNASADDTPAVVDRHRAADPRVVYAHEPEIGVSAARNRALALAASPLIAFIDDDATARPGWLARLLTPFFRIRPRPKVVGGDIDPIWGAPRPPWLADWMLSLFSAGMVIPGAPRLITENEWIFEGNCVVECRALRALGGFPVALGRREGKGALLSGENMVYEVIREQGGGVWFEPAARIRHHIHADRLNLRWLRRRCFWEGVSKSRRQRERTRLGLDVGRPKVVVPMNFDHWRALIDADESADEQTVARLIEQTIGLGFALDRMGLVDD